MKKADFVREGIETGIVYLRSGEGKDGPLHREKWTGTFEELKKEIADIRRTPVPGGYCVAWAEMEITTATGPEYLPIEDEVMEDNPVDDEALYMNEATGSIDTYDGWWYQAEDGRTVNAVDIGDVTRVIYDEESGDWERSTK